MRDLLLEVGTEEMPALFVRDAIRQLPDKARSIFSKSRIEVGEVQSIGTPRRIVLMISGVSDRQTDLETEIPGPLTKVAYDEEGNPTQAAIGFARSLGIEVSSLKIIEGDKGKRVCGVKVEHGKETIEVLPHLLCEVIRSLDFPKSMRWGTGTFRFARPIRWILALFGEEIVRFKIDDVSSGGATYGHRLLRRDPIPIKVPSEYKKKLQEAFVIVDDSERWDLIKDGLFKEAEKKGEELRDYESLLTEVTYLVEYPKVIRCSFDKKFLSLPSEVLIASMCEHQRYFPLFARDGSLRPSFLVVSNNPDSEDVIKKGNERVITARLSDAVFFFKEDTKRRLDERVEDERRVVWHDKLGTLFEKTQRLVELSGLLAGVLSKEEAGLVKRAAFLSKTDLLTEMVGEFPSLQGVMGFRYALYFGEHEDVAQGIREHYLPRFSGDCGPEGNIGAVLGLADRIDTISGFFGIGAVPTGSEDPYGLRRAAQAILEIILEKGYRLSIQEVFSKAIDLYHVSFDRKRSEILQDIKDFMLQRLIASFENRGINRDISLSCAEIAQDDPVDCLARARALSFIRSSKVFESLIVSFRRASNILSGISWDEVPKIRPEELGVAGERDLYEAYLGIKTDVERHLNEEDYVSAFKSLTYFCKPIDSFFDNVMVMVEEQETRMRRLGLLHAIISLFLKVADLSKLK
jgi:glycyl-tRNA synthetase beta chain